MFEIEKHKNLSRRIVIRTTEEMGDKIFKIADDNDVSVNNLILSCIEYALKNMK
jgi:predicted HicB family RNase H-like nuclease